MLHCSRMASRSNERRPWYSQIEPELPIDGSCQYWMNLPWGRGTGALPKGFSVGSPALCTYYGESQSVVGKHNLEIMKDN